MWLAVAVATSPVSAASSGWLDRTYGANGTVELRIAGNDDQINALGLVRSPRGVVVLSNARFRNVAPEEATGYRLDGLTSSGRRDGAFNGGNPVRAGYVSFGRASDLAGTATRVHVVGNGSDVALQFVRVDVYGFDGELDDSFAGDGVAFLELEPSVFGFQPHIAVLSDGAVRVCFTDSGAGGQVYMWGLTAAGEPDAAVGPGGLRALDIPEMSSCSEILVDLEDRIVIAGDSGPGAIDSAYIARFTSNGDIDPTFGTGGRTVLRWSTREFSAHGAVRLGDEGYVIAGRALDAGAEQDTSYTARFTDDGLIDTGYGFSGVYRYPADPIVRGIDVAGNGKLILGVASVAVPGFPPTYRERLLRIDAATGRLDATFGRNGAVEVFHRANDTVVDGLGRTITAGARSNSTTSVLVQRRLP
jgi:uncharacterized delta-60 repeat protein